MENEKNWKIIAITAICLLLVVSVLYAAGVGWRTDSKKNGNATPQVTTSAPEETSIPETTPPALSPDGGAA